MKKIKDTLWNRVFHNKALKEWKIEKKRLEKVLGWYNDIIQELNESKTLEDLLEVHKRAWKIGFRNDNIAPLEWGMFRAKDILQMEPSEVYLGGIWGLCTKNIPFWNEHCNETMAGNGFGIDDDKFIYELIMQQYRNHLRSNFSAIRNQANIKLFSK